MQLLKYLMRRRVMKISQMIVDLFSCELFEAQVAFCRQFGFVENDSEIVGHHSGTTGLVPFWDSVALCHVNLEKFKFLEIKTCCPHYMRFIMTKCVTDLALTLDKWGHYKVEGSNLSCITVRYYKQFSSNVTNSSNNWPQRSQQWMSMSTEGNEGFDGTRGSVVWSYPSHPHTLHIGRKWTWSRFVK